MKSLPSDRKGERLFAVLSSPRHVERLWGDYFRVARDPPMIADRISPKLRQPYATTQDLAKLS